MAISLDKKKELSLELRQALNGKKLIQKTIDAISLILVEYVEETGDDVFTWSDGLHLSYVHAVQAKPTVDYKKFFELSKEKMDPNDFATCVEKATHDAGARKAYFR